MRVRQLGPDVWLLVPDVPLFLPDHARAALLDVHEAYLRLALQDLAGHISEEAPVGVTGHLRQSWGGRRDQFGGLEVMGGTVERIEGRVFSSLPYAIVIDQGRRPGATPPPVAPIRLWAQRTLGLSGRALMRAAYVIARSIGRKGIAPRHYVQAGVARAEPRLVAIVEAWGTAIGRVLTGAMPRPGPGGVGL